MLSRSTRTQADELALLRELGMPVYAEKIYFETKPSWFTWKNQDAQYLGCTLESAARCDVSIKQILGKNELESAMSFPDSLREFFLLEDQHVLETGRKYFAFGSFGYVDSRRELCYTKERIWDEASQQFIVLGCGIEIPSYLLSMIPFQDIKSFANDDRIYFSNINLSAARHDLSFSEREEECLYLMLRGQTAKSIANILNISTRTVEYHIDNIKIKLHCVRKSQLLKVAIELGFYTLIPERFLPASLKSCDHIAEC